MFVEPKKQLSSHHREPEGRGNGQKDSHKDMGRKIQKEEDSLPEGDIKVAEEYIVPPAPLVSAFGGPAAERAVESLAAPALLQAAQSPFAQPLSAVDFSWSSPSSKNNPSGYPPPHPRKK